MPDPTQRPDAPNALQATPRYLITGVDVRGRRFTRTGDVLAFMLAINVWRGTLWQIVDGRRRKLCAYSN